MKKSAVVFGLLLLAVFIVSINAGTNRPARLTPDPGFGSTPLYFIANQGQTDRGVLYYATTPGQTLWLTQKGLVFDRTGSAASGEMNRTVSRLVFKNAHEDVALSPAELADYRVSYFYGRDEADWITDVPTSRAVLYKNLYDGVDLKVYGTDRKIEYDWIVRPSADPNRIRFSCEGEARAEIDGAGDLVVSTPSGELRHRKPSAYQVIEGKRVSVKAAFKAVGKGEYGFAVGRYDRRFDLVIDPLVLAFSTYLGGYGDEAAYSVAIDKAGAVYVAGYTNSTNFPPVKVSKPRNDAFVTKLSADGRSLVYSAFFPVSDQLVENIEGIAVDGKGSVYLVGTTNSRSFPIKNAFQDTLKGKSSGFFLKLTPNGKGLAFSSYLGGSVCANGNQIALDAAGAFFVGGETSSPDFPILKALQKTKNGLWDAYIAKFSSDGKTLIFSTYLGGNGFENSAAIALDSEGAVYIAGYTESTNFPIKNAFQKTKGGGFQDGFITKVSSAGQLVYSSYLGGSGYDYSEAVAVDGTGAAYITGSADGPFPLKNPFQKSRKGKGDAYVTKVAPDGQSLVYSTYLGGAGLDAGNAIAVDGNGNAYIVGDTSSYNFPVKDAYQNVLKGSLDYFLTILAPDGKSLVLSTLMGGSYKDSCFGIALGADGTILITGWTNSLDFPILKPFQKSLKNGYDAFVMKLKLISD
jgi:hypothetical protein